MDDRNANQVTPLYTNKGERPWVMKEVDPHPPSLCMANELLALVRSFSSLGSRESHKGTLNVIR